MKPSQPFSLRRALAWLACTGIVSASWFGLSGCAMVKQKDREYLADPIMQHTPDPQGAGMEAHNLPRREGSAGGSAGSGGGCGC
jgi:hypothetical protein